MTMLKNKDSKKGSDAMEVGLFSSNSAETSPHIEIVAAIELSLHQRTLLIQLYCWQEKLKNCRKNSSGRNAIRELQTCLKVALSANLKACFVLTENEIAKNDSILQFSSHFCK